MHLVGIDGAGKSSLQASLHKMLGKKLDVQSVYFGLGSGKKSWHRAILEIGRRKSTRVQSIGTSNTSHSVFGLVKKIKRAVYAVSVATEKRSKLKQVIALRSMGFIVICDRYPQLQSIGLNDGYILDDQNFSYGIWKLFYNLERKIMSVFERYYCDVLFFLEISAETAYDRKREESIDVLEQKRLQLTKIVENDNRARRTVSLDSGSSPSRLTYEIVSVIWKYLK